MQNLKIQFHFEYYQVCNIFLLNRQCDVNKTLVEFIFKYITYHNKNAVVTQAFA